MILGTQIASAIGLAINELATNAMKHAFPLESPGRICIRLSRDGGILSLSVRDNGRGGAKLAETGRDGSLGSRVVRSSITQIGGTITYADEAPGLAATISVPISE